MWLIELHQSDQIKCCGFSEIIYLMVYCISEPVCELEAQHGFHFPIPADNVPNWAPYVSVTFLYLAWRSSSETLKQNWSKINLCVSHLLPPGSYGNHGAPANWISDKLWLSIDPQLAFNFCDKQQEFSYPSRKVQEGHHEEVLQAFHSAYNHSWEFCRL